GPALQGSARLDFSTVATAAAGAGEIDYDKPPTPGQTQKRLIDRLRTIYRKDNLSALLPAGKLESLALPGDTYKMALTPGLLDVFQPKASRAELTGILTGPEGRYRALDGNPQLWISAGRIFYSPSPGDSAAQERAFAQAHFFLPHRFTDPFGNTTTLA